MPSYSDVNVLTADGVLLVTKRPTRADRTLTSIRALVETLTQSARAVERRTGVTNAQLFILRELQDGSELTINELAARVLTQQSTVSLLVTRLSRAGLVRRQRGEQDARQVCVTITPKGRHVTRRAPVPPLTRLVNALAQLNPEQRRALEHGLAALLKRMGVASVSNRPLFEPK